MSEQLLARHGIVTREVTAVESLPGGFAAIYPVLRRLEETGRVRRGYFVGGLGAAQFAQPGAVDRLRAERERPDDPLAVTLSATDPANPYGALLAWPDWPGPSSPRASRIAGARVIMIDGRLDAWIGRGDRQLLVALPEHEPDRSRHGRSLALELVRLAGAAPEGQRGWLIAEINGASAKDDPAAVFLIEAGFARTAGGLQLRVARTTSGVAESTVKPGLSQGPASAGPRSG
jgi:ATP-dependent Lhr-like helicase